MEGVKVVPAPRHIITRENTDEFTLPGRTCLPISLAGDSNTRFAILPDVENIDSLPAISGCYEDGLVWVSRPYCNGCYKSEFCRPIDEPLPELNISRFCYIILK